MYIVVTVVNNNTAAAGLKFDKSRSQNALITHRHTKDSYVRW